MLKIGLVAVLSGAILAVGLNGGPAVAQRNCPPNYSMKTVKMSDGTTARVAVDSRGQRCIQHTTHQKMEVVPYSNKPSTGQKNISK